MEQAQLTQQQLALEGCNDNTKRDMCCNFEMYYNFETWDNL